MPPALIGAGFVAMGATAATGAAVAAVATAVYVGAAIGALAGAAVAIVTGGDVLEGAIKGAIIGGVTKGIGAGMGLAADAGTTVARVGEAGVTGAEAGQIAQAGLGYTAGGAPAAVSAAAPAVADVASQAGTVGGTVTSPTTLPTPPPTTPPPSSGGFLSGATNWINQNPMPAALLAQTVGGAATGISESRSRGREIEAAMERDRLNILAGKVRGLNTVDLKVALPTISAFAERPKWTMPESGLLQKDTVT